MMRTRQPAGLVSNQLYLTMDDLADQVRINRVSQIGAWTCCMVMTCAAGAVIVGSCVAHSHAVTHGQSGTCFVLATCMKSDGGVHVRPPSLATARCG